MKCSRGHSPATAGLRRCSGPWACCKACARRVRSRRREPEEATTGERPRRACSAAGTRALPAGRAGATTGERPRRACSDAGTRAAACRQRHGNVLELRHPGVRRDASEMCTPARSALRDQSTGAPEGRWQVGTPRLRGDGGAVPQPLRAERPSYRYAISLPL